MKLTHILFSLLAALAVACGGSSKEASEPAETPPLADDPAAKETAPAEETAPAVEETPPAAGGEVTDADMEGIYQLFVKLAEVAKTTTPNCDPMADGFNKVLAEYKPLLDKLEPHKNDEAMAKKFQEKYGEQLQPVMMGFGSDVGPCSEHEGVRKALEATM